MTAARPPRLEELALHRDRLGVLVHLRELLLGLLDHRVHVLAHLRRHLLDRGLHVGELLLALGALRLDLVVDRALGLGRLRLLVLARRGVGLGERRRSDEAAGPGDRPLHQFDPLRRGRELERLGSQIDRHVAPADGRDQVGACILLVHLQGRRQRGGGERETGDAGEDERGGAGQATPGGTTTGLRHTASSARRTRRLAHHPP
jgi:hypothetical protein